MPLYDLQDIREKAKTDSINYSKKAEQDIINLGYSREDVCNCLCSLTEEHFKETVEYINNGMPILFDVYLITFSKSSDVNDNLYIKLKFRGWVTLQSFHL